MAMKNEQNLKNKQAAHLDEQEQNTTADSKSSHIRTKWAGFWQNAEKRKVFGKIFYPIWIALLTIGVIAIICVRTAYGLNDQSDSITYIIAVILGVVLVVGTIISAIYQKYEPTEESKNVEQLTEASTQNEASDLEQNTAPDTAADTSANTENTKQGTEQ